MSQHPSACPKQMIGWGRKCRAEKGLTQTVANSHFSAPLEPRVCDWLFRRNSLRYKYFAPTSVFPLSFTTLIVSYHLVFKPAL
ncbi:hypothetical protein SKAU_G00002710 [Synaphobranchus kaupii]|uniref:Uncharacterized protein n=1 Tax=Synaphobranchus kaupii TaxID=118154 RepID=A0A9Q1G9F3_SYNKA|nr:hypothetical protein SKAU_G00002710 [Synaphobranchus kaupii]